MGTFSQFQIFSGDTQVTGYSSSLFSGNVTVKNLRTAGPLLVIGMVLNLICLVLYIPVAFRKVTEDTTNLFAFVHIVLYSVGLLLFFAGTIALNGGIHRGFGANGFRPSYGIFLASISIIFQIVSFIAACLLHPWADTVAQPSVGEKS